MNPALSASPKKVCWRRILRLLWLLPTLLVSMMLAGALALFFWVDFVSFRPHLPDFSKMVGTQKIATPHVPDFLVRYWEERSMSDIDHFTARQLLHSHGLGSPSQLRMNFRSLMWSVSLKWHFSKADRVLLHCALIGDANGRLGIHHLSQRLLAKPLEQLDKEELAQLAIASTAPLHFQRQPEALHERTAALLERLESP